MRVIELEHRDGRIGTEIRLVRRAIQIRFGAADLPCEISRGGQDSANQVRKQLTRERGELFFPNEKRTTLSWKKGKTLQS